MTDKAMIEAARAITRERMRRENTTGVDTPSVTDLVDARTAIAAYERAMWRPIEECPEEWKDGRDIQGIVLGAITTLRWYGHQWGVPIPGAEKHYTIGPVIVGGTVYERGPTHVRPLPQAPEGE